MIKLLLIQPLSSCQQFKKLLAEKNLEVKKMFAGSETKFFVEGGDEHFQELHDCDDVFDCILVPDGFIPEPIND